MRKVAFALFILLCLVCTALGATTNCVYFGDWRVFTLPDNDRDLCVRMVTDSKTLPASLQLTIHRNGAVISYVHNVAAQRAPFTSALSFRVDDMPWQSMLVDVSSERVGEFVIEGATFLNWQFSLIEHMRRGRTAWVGYAGDSGTEQYVPFSLRGFTKAYLVMVQRAYDLFGPAWPGNHRPGVEEF